MLQLELHTFVGGHETEGFIKPERAGLMIKLGVQHIPIATYKNFFSPQNRHRTCTFTSDL